jgi:hypothetical protein
MTELIVNRTSDQPAVLNHARHETVDRQPWLPGDPPGADYAATAGEHRTCIELSSDNETFDTLRSIDKSANLLVIGDET